MKRVLLIAEDFLVANYYRSRLEPMGLKVDVARSADEGLRLAKESLPDLTLIDPIMPGASPIRTVEQLRAALGPRELWVISPLPYPVATALEKAGATRVQGRNSALAGPLFPHIIAALQLDLPPAEPDEELRQAWIHSVSGAAPDVINALRSTLHDFIRDPRNGVEMYEVFRQVHVLSHRVSMLQLSALSHLTDATDGLVYDLYAMPAQVNPSIVRTLSQTVDFMSILFEEENIGRVRDPAASDVCVVDDEPAARQIIAAAMKLAGLRITSADDSQSALTVLGDNRFDLIFLDVNLPHGTGFELCTQIRKLEDHAATPVVFLTGMNTFQNRAQGSLAGGNDFIGKPFNLLELGVKALTWIFKGQLALS